MQILIDTIHLKMYYETVQALINIKRALPPNHKAMFEKLFEPEIEKYLKSELDLALEDAKKVMK